MLVSLLLITGLVTRNIPAGPLKCHEGRDAAPNHPPGYDRLQANIYMQDMTA
jgi:hypothetical protein